MSTNYSAEEDTLFAVAPRITKTIMTMTGYERSITISWMVNAKLDERRKTRILKKGSIGIVEIPLV
jgi:hypothetical protein